MARCEAALAYPPSPQLVGRPQGSLSFYLFQGSTTNLYHQVVPELWWGFCSFALGFVSFCLLVGEGWRWSVWGFFSLFVFQTSAIYWLRHQIAETALLLVWVLCFPPPPLCASFSVSTLDHGVFGFAFVVVVVWVGFFGFEGSFCLFGVFFTPLKPRAAWRSKLQNITKVQYG